MSNCNLCEKRCNKRTASFSQCRDRIRHNYEHFCNEYLRLFCLKHDFDFDDAKDSWIGDRIGEVVCIGDYIFDMRTIRIDIDRNVPEEELLKWYDYSMEVVCLDMQSCNYNSWIAGCPRMSDANIERMKELKGNVKRAEEILKKKAKEYKEKFLNN